MRVLWITNIPMPEIANFLEEKESFTGGWMSSLSKLLSCSDGVELSIAFPKDKIKAVKEYFDGKVYHYAIPRKNGVFYDSSMEKYFVELINRCMPDIIHIHGTELAHGLVLINACPDDNYVVSIQGLVSVYAQHYYAGLPPEVVNKATFRDFIKHDNIKNSKELFRKRGLVEREIIKKTKHVIGRTEWDKACSRQINHSVQYYHCNESLRQIFYDGEWNQTTCQRYSIFISQGGYPIKGLHFVLAALPEIKKRFSDVHLYVAGSSIVKSGSIFNGLKMTSYGKYIRNLIKEYGLKDTVTFTGGLNAVDMRDRFLKSNVFVSASSIENSPNSLGEAMLLGVPCVASNVGGVTDLMVHREEGFLYPYDAPYMLAHYICEIFADADLALKLSRNAKKRALITHDREQIVSRTLEIYKEVLKCQSK